MTSPWLTVEEACAYLRMESKSARIHFMYLCRRGDIKAKKVNGHWLTKVEWLDAYIEGRRLAA